MALLKISKTVLPGSPGKKNTFYAGHPVAMKIQKLRTSATNRIKITFLLPAGMILQANKNSQTVMIYVDLIIPTRRIKRTLRSYVHHSDVDKTSKRQPDYAEV